MLKFFRNKKNQKRIYILLAVVIIPPFLFWGVMVSQEDKKINPATALGRIENRPISIQEYLKSYHAVQRQIHWMYGEQAKTILRSMNLKGEAWDRILLLRYAQKQKIKVGDQEVVDFLASQPIFLNHGKFNVNFYKAYVANYLRVSTRDLEEEMRQTLTIQKIKEKIRGEIHLSDAELRGLYDSGNGDVQKFEKENFREKMTDKKVTEKMNSLLENLRNQLTLNLDVIKTLFPSSENQ